MNITPTEAEQALEAIQVMVRKTQKAISKSGAYYFLIVWGFVWLFGFLSSHFVRGPAVGYIWAGLDILGGLLSAIIGIRLGQQGPQSVGTGFREADWLVLAAFICLLFFPDYGHPAG